MTAVETAPSTATTTASEPPPTWTPTTVLRKAGGVGLVLFPIGMVAGGLTSPPQDSDSTADYVRSLAADPAQTALSAGLFHYGWVAASVGFVATMLLVRGRRGRIATTVGALLGAFGAVQMSGLLLLDHYEGAMGRIVGTDAAVKVTDDVWSGGWTSFWLQSPNIALAVGIVTWVVGLARAGRLPWWSLATPLFFAAPFFLPGALGFIGTIGVLPFVLIALALLRRDEPAAG
ncbi:hypothetical protein ACXR2U_19260 [Jatrophihabitans sp. YIM 134969]